MLKKFIQFIKYNNATLVIILVFFVVGTSVFASEAGREVLGQKSTRIEGVDNTALLEVDLDKMDMDFKIEDIKEDEKYFYVTYTHLDLDKVNTKDSENGLDQKEKNIWQWQIQERVRKVSKKSGVDLEKYLIEEFKEEYQARIKKLKSEQKKAEVVGEEKVLKITEYSGLIGKTMALADNIFEDYEAVKVQTLPTPINSISLRELKVTSDDDYEDAVTDSLTEVYEEYVYKNDNDRDEVLNKDDNCPNDFNPEQRDRDEDEIGDVCDLNPDDAENNEKIPLLPIQGKNGEDTATPTDNIILDDDSNDITATPTLEIISEEEIDHSLDTPNEEDSSEIDFEVPPESEPEVVEQPSVTETLPNEEPDVVIIDLEE